MQNKKRKIKQFVTDTVVVSTWQKDPHQITHHCCMCHHRPVFWLHDQCGSGWSLNLNCSSLCKCELQSLRTYFPSGDQQIDFLFLLVWLERLWHSLHLPDEFSTWSLLVCALLCFVPPVYTGLRGCLSLPWGPGGTSWFWDTRSDASIWTQTSWVKRSNFWKKKFRKPSLNPMHR